MALKVNHAHQEPLTTSDYIHLPFSIRTEFSIKSFKTCNTDNGMFHLARKRSHLCQTILPLPPFLCSKQTAFCKTCAATSSLPSFHATTIYRFHFTSVLNCLPSPNKVLFSITAHQNKLPCYSGHSQPSSCHEPRNLPPIRGPSPL